VGAKRHEDQIWVAVEEYLSNIWMLHFVDSRL
jgi:hypothetical protein